MTCWPKSSRTNPVRPTKPLRPLLASVCLLLALGSTSARAQAADDVLSQKEVDTLRDTAFVPSDRVEAFEQFLNDREKQIQTLTARRHGHTDYGGDMHDLLDQFGQIADEFNDNLDEYNKQHRDVRKVLPKLLQTIDRWTATLNSTPENDAYNIVRRIAVDNLKDTREIVEGMQTDLAAYFKAHPEAAKAEKARNANPHAVRPE